MWLGIILVLLQISGGALVYKLLGPHTLENNPGHNADGTVIKTVKEQNSSQGCDKRQFFKKNSSNPTIL